MAGAGGATAVQQPAAAAAAARNGGGAAGAPAVADPRAEALRCPRCDSANTKFCYYNNYSLSQPRHFCKACKRYWTRGGTLRNVPVGGGCRKNKRSRSGGNGGRNPPCVGVGAAAGSCAVSSAASALSLPPHTAGGSSMQSLTSALGLHGGASLASLLLGSGGSGGDHLGFFHAAMQSVVSDSTGYDMQHQQQHTQVDHLLGLSYGGGGQIQLKPWMQESGGAGGGGGIMDSFYAPLLSSSLVPGLEELHVKAEAAGAGEHNQQQKGAAGDPNGWEITTPSSSNVDANIMASDALMAAAASMNNPAVSSASTAPSSAPSSFMYWGNSGIGGGAAAWPDIPNCGSSIATLF